MTLKKAYSTLTIKSFDEDSRTIEGIASTPSTDRQDDIVEPKGAQFTLPIPLLWMHRSSEPVGHVIRAKVTKEGITVVAQFAKVDEPPSLKDELDRAWAMVKARLVRGLSIGFSPIETADIEGSAWGRRFIKWDWLELSAVVIPANQDASITSIKSVDEQQLQAALGHRAANPLLKDLGITPPGASGKKLPLSIPKGTAMKTFKERIEALEASRAAKAARMADLAAVNDEKGETFGNSPEGEEFDTLQSEILAIDKDIVRYTALDKLNLEKAVAVPAVAATDPTATAVVPARTGLIVRSQLKPGIKMARYAMTLHQAKGNISDAVQIFQNNKDWMSSSPEVLAVLKTAVAAGDTTTSGWASQMVYAENLANEFIDYLRPLTILGRLSGFRMVPFNIRVGSQTAGGTGYWVGQGLPIPMSKLTTSSTTLGITKAAGMMAIDDELARSSSPSAEMKVRDDLAKTIQQLLDTALIDPNQGGVANVQPASLTYGVTPITPSGTTFAAFATDVKALFATMIAANLDTTKAVWIVTPSTALSLSLMQTALGTAQFPSMSINGGTLMGLPVIVTNTANISGSPDFANMMVLINPSEVFLADDGQVAISVSNEASIQMLDNPTNQSTGATVPTTLVSMFQTQSLAIKAVRYINWGKARAEAVAFIRTAAYA